MKNLYLIWKYNLLEFSRDRLLHVMIGLLLTFVMTTLILSNLALSQSAYVIISLSLTALEISGIFLVLSASLNLHREIKRRTILAILTKPISRAHYYLGKFFAVATLAVLVMILGGIGILGVLMIGGESVDFLRIAAALGVMVSEIFILAALAQACSFLTSPGLTVFFTLGFWSCGKLSADLYEQINLSSKLGSSIPIWLKFFSSALYWLLPDLSSFDLSLWTVHPILSLTEVVFSPIAVGLGFSALFLSFGLFFFYRKDFS